MENLRDKLAFVLGNLIMAGFFILGIYLIISVKSIFSIVAVVSMAVTCGIISGIFFYLLYIRKWADDFVDVIYSQSKKYKSLRPNILHIQGAIQREQYEEAREDLKAICEEYPYYMEAVFMLFNLYFEKLKDYENAYWLAKKFFDNKKAEKNIDFLFRYSDLLNLCQATDKNLELLKRELKKSQYSTHEKKMISLRIKHIEN